jgi:hypothetical protein
MNPLVPAHVQLRDFAFMPLDVVRLRDSDLATESSGEEFRAAVLLWCSAWHQAPAASLPDNDQVLAKFAGFGRDRKAWLKVKSGALRGFELCSDGRLYHRVLAEKAIEAWDGKLRHRWRRECERIKKAAQRAKADAVYPSFDEWKEHVALTGDDRWIPDRVAVSQGTDEGRPNNVQRESQPLKGQGEGEGQGQGEKSSSALSSSSETHTLAVVGVNAEARACVLMDEAGCKSTNPSHPELARAIAEGITPETLRDTAIEAIKLGKTNPFAWACTTARRRKAAGVTDAVKTAAPAKASAEERQRERDEIAARRAAVRGKPLPPSVTELAQRLGVGSA